MRVVSLRRNIGDEWGLDAGMISAMKKSKRSALSRILVDRELILRTEGKVRYLRMSRQLQGLAGVVSIAAAGWFAYTSSTYMFYAETIASKEQEIEQHRLAYVDLLSEIGDPDGEIKRIQGYLDGNAALVAQSDATSETAEQSEAQAVTGQVDPAQANATAGAGDPEALARLARVEEDLREMVDRNCHGLRLEIANTRNKLRSTQEGKVAAQDQRDDLADELSDVRDDLADVTEARDGLREDVDNLASELERSRDERETLAVAERKLQDEIQDLETMIGDASERETALNEKIGELERILGLEVAKTVQLHDEKQSQSTAIEGYEERVAELEREIEKSVESAAGLSLTIAELEGSLEYSLNQAAQLKNQRDYYEARVVNLEQRLEAADLAEAEYDRTIADLKSSLATAAGRSSRLEQQRDFYEERVTALEDRLDDLRGTQETIVKRLSDRTMVSLETMERTLAFTGLDISLLLSHTDIDPSGFGMGGPFVPGDYISETDYGDDLLASVRVLDMQMSRWEALQAAFRRLPLVAPVDHYRLTSKFGVRVDPINGRRAFHSGIDMGAPLRTSVLSTAPGKVVFAGWRGRYGRMIEIDHGLGIHTRYGHLKKILVKPGQEVGHRDKIGLLGSSGRSTGPHVHYEVLVNGKPHDPLKFLKAGKNVFKG